MATVNPTLNGVAQRDRFGRLTRWWIIGCLMLGTFLLFLAAPERRPSASDQDGILTGVASEHTAFEVAKRIEDVQVGDRVAPSTNPGEAFDDAFGLEVDSATWRQVELRTQKPDGSIAQIVLLRPDWWFEQQQVTDGSSFHLTLPEFGIEGPAEVLLMGPCPSIPEGAGRVVTGTFAHQSSDVVDVYVEGLSEPIGVTTNHPFWSDSHEDFVPVEQLVPGDRLHAFHGSPRITKITPRGPPQAVYNLEIHGEHVYEVSSLGLLVHNDCVSQQLRQLEQGVPRKPTPPTGTRLADLPDYANGVRGTLSHADQVAVTKSIRRHMKKRGGNTVDLGFVDNYRGRSVAYSAKKSKLFRMHWGEQMLELNRLSLFHPKRLQANIAIYDALRNGSMGGVNWVDYMRRTAGRRLLGEKPILPADLRYPGQQFHAGHTLDAVAGGDFWRFKGWTDSTVNSAMGSQWKTRRQKIEPGKFHR